MGAVGLTEAGVTAAAAAAAHRGHSHLNGTQAPSSSVPRPIGTPAIPVAASSIKQRGMAPKRGSLATFKHIFAKYAQTLACFSTVFTYLFPIMCSKRWRVYLLS
jgi:hypothetical protein